VKPVEKKPAPAVTVTNKPAPVIGNRVPVQPTTNQWISQRGVRVYTNATDAARIGLTRIDETGLPNLTANFTPRPVAAGRDLEIQVALDRRGFSPGSIDGMSGPAGPHLKGLMCGWKLPRPSLRRRRRAWPRWPSIWILAAVFICI
jgi:hypothetical protein